MTTEAVEAHIAGARGLPDVTAQTGVVHLHVESLIPTYREATDEAVEAHDQNLVQYRAHRLFLDHPLVVRIAQMNGIGDAHGL